MDSMIPLALLPFFFYILHKRIKTLKKAINGNEKYNKKAEILLLLITISLMIFIVFLSI